MLFFYKNTFFAIVCTFLLPVFFAFGQTAVTSYEKLWHVIDADNTPNEQKLHYLDLYLEKAQQENNLLEEYQALKKKTYIVPFNEAVMILHKMHPVVQKLANDSITGNFYNRSTVLYYKQRYFKQALDYAIASEAFNEKINNLYNLNGVRIDIGNIYYHTRYYKKAEVYFTKAKKFYKINKDYNYHRSYIVALYSLGKTYLEQEETAALQSVIKESEKALPQLKPRDRQFENAYLNYLKGGMAFLQNQLPAARQFLEAALPEIKQNGDFTNEHVIYLYLGKILWAQNNKDEAVTYFNKIDSLFNEKKFLNYELRETYDYLAAYYKETGQTALQLKANENLNLLNQQFEKEQKSITDRLHNELETKKIETERSQLQKKLNSNKRTYTLWLVVAGVVLLVLTAYSYRKNRDQKKLKQKFNELLDTVTEERFQEKNDILKPEALQQSIVELPGKAEESTAETATQTAVSLQKNNISSQKVNEQRLFRALEKFEQEKGFLKLIKAEDGSLRALKIEDLVEQFGTNRTTLSHFLNTHKGGFTTYIVKLRIKQMTIDLSANEELRKKSVQELSELYGFASLRSFNIQFKEQTGLTPSYFVKELELRMAEEKARLEAENKAEKE